MHDSALHPDVQNGLAAFYLLAALLNVGFALYYYRAAEPRRHDLADQGLGQRHQPAAAGALQDPGEDQRQHGRRHGAGEAGGQERDVLTPGRAPDGNLVG